MMTDEATVQKCCGNCLHGKQHGTYIECLWDAFPESFEPNTAEYEGSYTMRDMKNTDGTTCPCHTPNKEKQDAERT